MENDLVNALAKLRILLIGRHELGAHAVIPHLPGISAVVCAIDPAGRYCNVHTFGVSGVGQDCVQAEPSAARLPLGAMGMVVQTLDQ
jgi:hypothetical protein